MEKIYVVDNLLTRLLKHFGREYSLSFSNVFGKSISYLRFVNASSTIRRSLSSRIDYG